MENKLLEFQSFGEGTIKDISKVNDPMFSKKIMGDGYAIELTKGDIYSPVNAKVTATFPTGHAYGLKTLTGLELLIHIGIDTINLEGKGIIPKVKKGDIIEKGDLIAQVDLDYFRKKGVDFTTIIVFTSGEKIDLIKDNQRVHYKSKNIFKFV